MVKMTSIEQMHERVYGVTSAIERVEQPSKRYTPRKRVKRTKRQIEGAIGIQGKEATIILQAPTRQELNELIQEHRELAEDHGMHKFKVLERGSDPDGGFRAIVTAHNFLGLGKIGRALTKKRYLTKAGKERGEEKATLKTSVKEAKRKTRERAKAGRQAKILGRLGRTKEEEKFYKKQLREEKQAARLKGLRAKEKEAKVKAEIRVAKQKGRPTGAPTSKAYEKAVTTGARTARGVGEGGLREVGVVTRGVGRTARPLRIKTGVVTPSPGSVPKELYDIRGARGATPTISRELVELKVRRM